jgi:transcription-repair coupling factor (superfamily II helicase)
MRMSRKSWPRASTRSAAAWSTSSRWARNCLTASISFDNEIESIKTFDVDNQRTLYPVPEVRLLPAREFPLDDRDARVSASAFREMFEGDPGRSGIYKDVSNGIAAAGIEYWLPLFFEETATLFDYLPRATRALPARQRAGSDSRLLARGAVTLHDALGRAQHPLLPPADLFLAEEPFFVAAKAYARVSLTAGNEGPVRSLPSLAVDRRAEDPLCRLKAFLDGPSQAVSCCSPKPPGAAKHCPHCFGIRTEARRARVLPTSWPATAGSRWRLARCTTASCSINWRSSPKPNSTPTARRGARATRRSATSVDNWLRDLTELKVGSPVVHEQHGIARYQGLIHLDLGEGEMEFLELHYAGDARLYVPVSQLHVISRYSGADPDAPLHTLGSQQWEKAKRRAALQARDTAAELLALYALRAARQGHACEFKAHDYDAFADGFGFEETQDQATAIAAVIEDMKSGPADGPPGLRRRRLRQDRSRLARRFLRRRRRPAGRRPVPDHAALRTAFPDLQRPLCRLAGQDRRTVALQDRRRGAQALKELADGKLDIVIGTHKLLQKDVHFSRLGLVVIDEEHRFGVRQKEALKALRAEVDVLTLTATPIPRTLAMSLEGLRDFSVIATAPQKRLAIKTFVSRFSDGIIREALLREFKRGGQVYFLHNEVDTIENMRDKLGKLLPEARIVVGHGQMKERDLERVMRDFTQQRANLLLCTTIIETGIDNPHANTIVINRAEKFGLAQLHQLRGRVGRSHHQAYAYLLTHDETALNKQARQRLEAIQMMDELGAGFYLAMHDLEIRGAGEVLGASQSGEMQEVGFNLFTEMLKRAVAALKQGKEPDLMQPLAIATEIKLHTPALLPDDYAPDVHERLTLYKRLADCGQAATNLPICRKNWSIALATCRRRRGPCSTATGCGCSANRSASASSTPHRTDRRAVRSRIRRSTRCASSI